MKCEVTACVGQGERIDSGHLFCRDHGIGHLAPEEPLRVCEVPGCDHPTPHLGAARCVFHERWAA